jgi:hypothetical protein
MVQASRGEQVLLNKIIQIFKFYLDFIDGDIQFRLFHHMADLFIDDNSDLSPLTGEPPIKKIKTVYKWEKTPGGDKLLPPPYDFRKQSRAPVVKIGYGAFEKGGYNFFEGPLIGDVRKHFYFFYFLFYFFSFLSFILTEMSVRIFILFRLYLGTASFII